MENFEDRIIEVSFSVDELRAVTKSLNIGADQLSKKLARFPKSKNGGDYHYRDLCNEYELLTNALAECQSVLSLVLRSYIED